MENDKIEKQLIVKWADSGFGLPQPESVFLIPSGTQFGNDLILKNIGSMTARINRIELEPTVKKRHSTQSGSEITVDVPVLQFQSGNCTDLGLELKPGKNGKWVMDTPLTVGGGQEVELPSPVLSYAEEDKIAVQHLVGKAMLELQYKVVMFADQETSGSTLTAPLRLLFSMDLITGGDGGIDSLMEGLADIDEAEKNVRGETYRQIRQTEYEVRKASADGLNEMLEQEQLNEMAEEIEPYDEAIERNPSDPEAYYAKGHFLLEMGTPRAALDTLDKSLKFGNNSPELQLDRGNLLLGLERWEEAVQALDSVLQVRPQASAFVLKGVALLNLDHYEEALDAHDQAIRLDPGCVEAHYRRGLALFGLGRLDEAMAAFRRASEINPDYANAYYGQALSLAGQGPDDDFLAAVQKALEQGFSDWEKYDVLELLVKKETKERLRQLVAPYRAKETIEPGVTANKTAAVANKGDGSPIITPKTVKTILILAANPKNTPSLRLDQEIRDIENGLERAQKRNDYTLKQKLAARPQDVRRAMLDFHPNIVHFCGHGSGDEGLAFEDDAGQALLVNENALSGLFKLFADKVECVILNACFSELQADAIVKHIPYVIGMKKAIGDDAAIEFAVAFYDALGAGESIVFAYNLACNAIQWKGIPEHLTPVLKTKAGV